MLVQVPMLVVLACATVGRGLAMGRAQVCRRSRLGAGGEG